MGYDCVLQNTTTKEYLDYWLNPPTNDQIIEAKVLEKYDDGDTVRYWRFKLPMMSDRDNIQHTVIKEVDGGTLGAMKSVEHA